MPSTTTIAHNLPVQTTSFIGRASEISTVAQRLRDAHCCLLTLVGPGGVGKTRLAIEVARTFVETPQVYPDGDFFIPLVSLLSPNNIVPTIADGIGLQFYPGKPPREQLLDYLRDKQMLLVIDNFEHLLDGVDLISEIVQAAPQVTVLATSRERLNLREEWVWDMRGLHFVADTIEVLETSDAFDLFVERARQVRQNFSPADDNTAVIRICQLVEGMPLALEMAASWCRTLGTQAIADQIQSSLDFLTSNQRNVSDRHRNIRAVFDHSWSLLTPAEQDVFRKLSVFRGGFTQEAAEQVTGATLHDLTIHMDKSFIHMDDSGRYDVHELMRQYGEEQLENSDNVHSAREAHSDYYLTWLDQHEMNLKGHEQLEALNDIETDLENVRTAWEWAIERQNDLLINRALESLFWFLVSRYRLQEGADLFQQAFEKEATSSRAIAEQTVGRLLARQIYMQVQGYIVDENVWEQIEKSLKIAKKSNNQAEIAFCTLTMGEIAFSTGAFESALLHYEQALTLYRQLDDRFYMARTLNRIGSSGVSQGQFEESREALSEGLDLARTVGDRISTANCLSSLAALAGFSGDYVTYDAARLESLSIQREMNDRAGSAQTLAAIAIATLYQGDFVVTASLAEESLEIAKEFNHLASESLALILQGLLAIIEEDYIRSQQLLEAARSLTTGWFTTVCAELGLAIVACGTGNYVLARVRMQSIIDTPSVWSQNRLWPRLLHLLPVVSALILIDEGNTIRGLEILSSAFHYRSGVGNILKKWSLFSRLQTSLKSDLEDEIYTAAWERGKAQNLEDVMAGLLDQLSSHKDSSENMISVQMKAANQMLDEPLTPREHEILILIAQGLSNRQIAEQLFIEVSTVKRHIHNCYGKLGVSSRTQAIHKAQQLGLV